jgi:hypothetical protein
MGSHRCSPVVSSAQSEAVSTSTSVSVACASEPWFRHNPASLFVAKRPSAITIVRPSRVVPSFEANKTRRR